MGFENTNRPSANGMKCTNCSGETKEGAGNRCGETTQQKGRWPKNLLLGSPVSDFCRTDYTVFRGKSSTVQVASH